MGRIMDLKLVYIFTVVQLDERKFVDDMVDTLAKRNIQTTKHEIKNTVILNDVD